MIRSLYDLSWRYQILPQNCSCDEVLVECRNILNIILSLYSSRNQWMLITRMVSHLLKFDLSLGREELVRLGTDSWWVF